MKRVTYVLLALCILLSLCRLPSVSAAQDAAVYVRKHVSILYDNSGSMRNWTPGETNLKWCYASYAAQAFTGLLNDTDSLSITFMEGASLNNLDLKGLRQDAVTAVLNATTNANADTPIDRIRTALEVLENEGLKAGYGANNAGEQFWLVLTTDGIFREHSEDLSADRVVSELEAILSKYPDLYVVYFGIGTQDNSSAKAVDFRKGSGTDPKLLERLHAHANFTAVYAENQGQIVQTMQSLSNQISGRYTVPDEIQVSGSQVRLYPSGEGSPIRNIALMAQETDAKLLSATAEDGTRLTIDREAVLRYPNNKNYNNVPAGTKGGYVALITGPGGEKVPNGVITLEFSEPVSADKLSLMYEPAIHIRLLIERQLDNGQWERLSDNADLVEGDVFRASYVICEDGTNRELDTAKLFGRTEATILCNGKEIQSGEAVTAELGDTLLDVRVSMMDGGYQISTSRTLHVIRPGAGDFTIRSSGPIELRRGETADNTGKSVEFSILFRDAPADPAYLGNVRLEVSGDAGPLKGLTENPEPHVFRFTPRDDACRAGDYAVHLFIDGTEVASEAIRILPNETTYTAEAGPSISLLNNQVGSNQDPVTFTVTAHRDDGDGPITAAEADQFTVRAEENGKSCFGYTGWEEGGVIRFVLQDAGAEAGTCKVSLWHGDQKLAQTEIVIIQYDADYTVETVVSDPNSIDRYDLLRSTACVSFIVYEDGVPCSPTQLDSMLDRQLLVSHDLSGRYAGMDIQIGTANGKPAIVCTPVSTTQSRLRYFFRKFIIALHLTGLNRGEIHTSLTVDMPKGDTGSGVLYLTGSGVIYLIILAVLLLILILVGLFLFANFKAIRLYKGLIWGFTLENSGRYLTATRLSSRDESLGWGWKPMPFVPVNESHEVSGVRFEASADAAKMHSRRKTWFRRVHPTVRISGKTHDPKNFYRSDVSDVAAGLLDQIKSGLTVTLKDGKQPLSAKSFFAFAAAIADPLAEDPSTAAYHISQNRAMIYEAHPGKNEHYTVWVYEVQRQEKPAAKKHSYQSGKKRTPKKSATSRRRRRR